jgi:hypothetical protein
LSGLEFYSIFRYSIVSVPSRTTKLGENQHFILLFYLINMLELTSIFDPELFLS